MYQSVHFWFFSFYNKSIISHKSASLDWQLRASGLFRASVKRSKQNRYARLDEGDEAARRSSEM